MQMRCLLFSFAVCLLHAHAHAGAGPAQEVQERLESLHAQPASVGSLDDAWANMQRLTFLMGHLLPQTDLAGVLHQLAIDPHPLDRLVLLQFARQYGDERVPRSLPPPPIPTLQELEELADAPNALVAACALAALVGQSTDTDLAAPVEAINAFAVHAPDALLLRQLVRTFAAALLIAEKPFSLLSDYAWAPTTLAAIQTDSLLQPFLMMPAQQEADPLLLQIVLQNSDPTERLWAANVIASRAALSPDPSWNVTPEGVYSGIKIFLGTGNPQAAAALLPALAGSTLPQEALLPLLNELGMALVRLGETASAIDVFGRLAAECPGSALADRAAEHVLHLRHTLPTHD
jgi:hypothetical protein